MCSSSFEDIHSGLEVITAVVHILSLQARWCVHVCFVTEKNITELGYIPYRVCAYMHGGQLCNLHE